MDILYEIANAGSPTLRMILKLSYKNLYNRLRMHTIPNNSRLSDILRYEKLRLFPDLKILDISWNQHIRTNELKGFDLHVLKARGYVPDISLTRLYEEFNMPIEYLDISNSRHFIDYEFGKTLKYLIMDYQNYFARIQRKEYNKVFYLSNVFKSYSSTISRSIVELFFPNLHYYVKDKSCNDFIYNDGSNRRINNINVETKLSDYRALPNRKISIYIKNRRYKLEYVFTPSIYKNERLKKWRCFYIPPAKYLMKMMPKLIRMLKIKRATRLELQVRTNDYSGYRKYKLNYIAVISADGKYAVWRQ